MKAVAVRPIVRASRPTRNHPSLYQPHTHKKQTNSYFPHLENAQKHGLDLNTPKLHGIGLDIDTPEDLLELCRLPERTRAQEYLHKQKILERLETPHV